MGERAKEESRPSRKEAIYKIFSPLMPEFRTKDVVQVMVGSSILAIPVALTEETWKLGETLPLPNVFAFLAISLVFVSTFVFYNYYRTSLRQHWLEFLKRVISTYLLSFLVVASVLTMIQKAPWQSDWMLAFKRAVIVTFPSSMSAAVADTIK